MGGLDVSGLKTVLQLHLSGLTVRGYVRRVEKEKRGCNRSLEAWAGGRGGWDFGVLSCSRSLGVSDTSVLLCEAPTTSMYLCPFLRLNYSLK